MPKIESVSRDALEFFESFIESSIRFPKFPNRAPWTPLCCTGSKNCAALGAGEILFSFKHFARFVKGSGVRRREIVKKGDAFWIRGSNTPMTAAYPAHSTRIRSANLHITAFPFQHERGARSSFDIDKKGPQLRRASISNTQAQLTSA